MGKIEESIIGYEYVKNVVAIVPTKAKKQTFMFVVRKSSGRDILSGITKVMPYTTEEFWKLYVTLSHKIYRVYVGEIIDTPNGKSIIRFT